MKNVLIIVLSILVLGCSSDDDNSEVINIQSSLIAKDNLYGNGAEGIMKQNLIISDQTSWNDLIGKMNLVNNTSDNFKETDIDFTTHTIIAVFDEIKGNGGHSLELNIISNSKKIMVNVTDSASEGNFTTVITQPFHIVKIQNSDLPIIFK
jgi:hypothetical protein